MFRFFAKSAIATLIWKRYHRVIVATLSLLLGYFLISMIHGDYVDYAQGAQDTKLLWLSYIAKWFGLIAITALYYFYLKFVLTPKPTTPTSEPARDSASKTSTNRQTDTTTSESDPFASIREKETLKSRADIALDSHRHNKRK
ncbi:hypothetical protein [Gilvimarinus sp. DA14]|uniref:hypothetical protein n=1 Tax=Gilvimarinus sp. DA14 TaxID=2956798 RepID=UPI0020B817C2|nr:hypothetical protein [Gilvimarinus sp. DA14]UTF58811.1 hypothetical protein NHM04_09995 [Gilvimarinus sp. DA14]